MQQIHQSRATSHQIFKYLQYITWVYKAQQLSISKTGTKQRQHRSRTVPMLSQLSSCVRRRTSCGLLCDCWTTLCSTDIVLPGLQTYSILCSLVFRKAITFFYERSTYISHRDFYRCRNWSLKCVNFVTFDVSGIRFGNIVQQNSAHWHSLVVRHRATLCRSPLPSL